MSETIEGVLIDGGRMTARQRKVRGRLRAQAVRRALRRMSCPPVVRLYDMAGRVTDTILQIRAGEAIMRAALASVYVSRHYRCRSRVRTCHEVEYVIWLASWPTQ